MIDLKTMSEEEWEEHLVAVDAERDRRWAMATTPDNIRAQTQRYLAQGGDKADLIDAVESADQAGTETQDPN